MAQGTNVANRKISKDVHCISPHAIVVLMGRHQESRQGEFMVPRSTYLPRRGPAVADGIIFREHVLPVQAF
jgi:hypothetical protein